MEENVDYYKQGDKIVFTAQYHIKRGSCCGSGCKNCPFEPTATKGNRELKKEFLDKKLK
jgi:2-iminoacetate synthase ThiH